VVARVRRDRQGVLHPCHVWAFSTRRQRSRTESQTSRPVDQKSRGHTIECPGPANTIANTSCKALPIHPASDRTPTFRNPNSVARKLADIHTHQPGYTGKPTSGSRLDEEIWEVYSKDPEQLRATAQAIIEGAETFSTPEDDEVDIVNWFATN
jgi:hypothetical protein